MKPPTTSWVAGADDSSSEYGRVAPALALDVRDGTPSGGAGAPHPVSLGSRRASSSAFVSGSSGPERSPSARRERISP